METKNLEAKNYTAHDVIFYRKNAEVLRIPPSGYVARVINHRKEIGTIVLNGTRVPVTRLVSKGLALISRADFMAKKENPELLPFPEPAEGVRYIVSAMVQDAMPHRTDLLAPDTDASVVDEAGRIIGVPGVIVK